ADAGIAVAEERGPVAAAEVDVFATVEVPDSTAGSAVEEHGVADGPVEPGGRRDAAGQVLTGALILLADPIHPRPSGRSWACLIIELLLQRFASVLPLFSTRLG